jgi:hypothetical protein
MATDETRGILDDSRSEGQTLFEICARLAVRHCWARRDHGKAICQHLYCCSKVAGLVETRDGRPGTRSTSERAARTPHVVGSTTGTEGR